MKMTFAEQLQAIKDGKTVKQAMEEAAQQMQQAKKKNKKTAGYDGASAQKYLEKLVQSNKARGLISDFPGAKGLQAREQGGKDARALFGTEKKPD